MYISPVADRKTDNQAGDDAPPARTRHAQADEKGRWHLSRLPVGAYRVTARSEYHNMSDKPVAVTVAEGGAGKGDGNLVLRATRSEATLALTAHPSVWATQEKPYLPVRGYVRPICPTVRLTRSMFASTAPACRSFCGAGTMPRKLCRRWATPTRKPSSVCPPPFWSLPGFAPADWPRRVFDGDVTVRDADREGFFAQRIALPAGGGPGLYLVEVTQAPLKSPTPAKGSKKPDPGAASLTAWALSTDTALIIKRTAAASRPGATDLLTFAVDMNTGHPVGGASIAQYKRGQVVARAVAGKDGLATVALPAPPPARRPASDNGDAGDTGNSPADDNTPTLTVCTTATGDEAVLTGTGGTMGDERAGGYVVHSYTDRPVYRPGHTVSFKGIVRQRAGSGSAEPYLAPRGGEAVTVQIRDEQGNRIAVVDTTTNRNGSYVGTVDLPTEAATGTYSLVASVGGEKHSSEFMVASYRKPEFTVKVAPHQARYIKGDTVQFDIHADYYFGTPVRGG